MSGLFVQDVINLKLNMTKFLAEVFLNPLIESSGLNINLNPGKKYIYLTYEFSNLLIE